MTFLIKTLFSAVLIALASQLAKRSLIASSILVSLPLTSILAMVWIYNDTKDIEKVISMSSGIFWAVFPSLLFFLAFPLFLKLGLRFYIALPCASIVMAVAYWLYVLLVRKFGVEI